MDGSKLLASEGKLGTGLAHSLGSWTTPKPLKPLGVYWAEDLQGQCLICLRNSMFLRILAARKFAVVSKFGLCSHPFPPALSSGGEGLRVHSLVRTHGWSPAQPCPPPPSASSSLGGMTPAPLISSLWFPSLDLKVKSVSCSVRSDSFRPRGLQPAGLLCPWDSPGRHTGVGCHSLLQGIFLTCLNRILDKRSRRAVVPNLQGLMPDDLRWS